MKKVILLLCLLSYINLSSQEYFSKTYFVTEDLSNRGFDIETINDEIYIISGRRCNDFSVDCGEFVRINSSGSIMNRTLVDWVDFNVRPLEILNDTVFLGVGFSNSIPNLWNLLQFKNDGMILSNEEIDFSQTHIRNLNIGIDKIRDGYIMYGFGDDLGSNEVLSIVLLDDELELDTMYNIQFDPDFNWIIDVTEDFSGDMVFMATHGTGIGTLDERRVVRMNRTGEETWSWTTGIQKTDNQPNAFELHPQGSYFFYQYNDQADMMDIRRNVYLYNVDTTGTVRWIHEFVPDEDGDIDIFEMTIAANGDILVVGDIREWDEPIDTFRPHRGYIARMSYDGELLWERHIFDRHESGMEKKSYLYDIAEMEDGSIVATGHQERIEGEFWKDLWVVKLSPDGCLNTPNCSDTLDISVATLEIDDTILDYSISPNPSAGIFTISLDGDLSLTRELSVVIYNQQGHILLTTALREQQQVDLSTYPDGLYFYTILDNGRVLDSGKLIKEE